MGYGLHTPIPPIRPPEGVVRFRRLATLACLASLPLLVSCDNGSNNSAIQLEAGGRFRLSIEASRTGVAGTHFLLDTATGDLWRLDASGDGGDWSRVADAPTDATELESPFQLLEEWEESS